MRAGEFELKFGRPVHYKVLWLAFPDLPYKTPMTNDRNAVANLYVDRSVCFESDKHDSFILRDAVNSEQTLDGGALIEYNVFMVNTEYEEWLRQPAYIEEVRIDVDRYVPARIVTNADVVAEEIAAYFEAMELEEVDDRLAA